MIAYGRQHIDQQDIDAVQDVLVSDFLTTGPKVADFESSLAQTVGALHAVACANGTAALHLACMALGLGPDDAVIVPSITFLATANAAAFVGAEVIFSDVCPKTGLMRVSDFEDALKRGNGKKIKAVIPVSLAGQTPDIESIFNIAKENNIAVIIDSCHALGSSYTDSANNSSKAGACAYADMEVFSFHPVKTITTGEGGAITTNNPELYEKLLRLRSHGMVVRPDTPLNPEMAYADDGSINSWYYEMPTIGYNYRISDILCALGYSQLAKLDKFVARRQEIAAIYDEKLADLAPYIQAPERVTWCTPSLHLYALRCNFTALGKDRNAIMKMLLEQGVGTQVHYIPVHTQPYYTAKNGTVNLPGAEEYYKHTLSIPLYPAMDDSGASHVIATIQSMIKGLQ